MREIRLSGSEGGGTEFNRFSLPRLVKQLVRSCDRRMFSIDAIPASASLTSAETTTVLTRHPRPKP